MLYLVHVIFSIILFFVVNFIGQHTPSNLRYYQLTTFLETEEAPAFNFLLRVLTPNVFILILSSLLYAVQLDRFVQNIYLVTLYYVFFRAAFNIAVNRSALINWNKQLLYSASIVGLAYLLYKKVVITKSNLLPDFNNIANELWIIILIFIYSIVNNMQVSDSGKKKRTDRFINLQFSKLNRKFGPLISQITSNARLRQLAIAIIIYESFNRPFLFRIIEYISYILSRKPHTLGIMQVRTNKLISDKESVTLGVTKLSEQFAVLQKEFSDDSEEYSPEYKDSLYQQKLIEHYNPDKAYSSEILELADMLNERYFRNATKTLFT
jgi:hypothetical protein